MTEAYPRIRLVDSDAEDARLLARDVVRIVFYLPHDHVELGAGVEQVLPLYRHAVGDVLTRAWDSDGESFPLTEAGWGEVQASLRPSASFRFIEELAEDSDSFQRMTRLQAECSWTLTGDDFDGYSLRYLARLPSKTPLEGSVSVLSATLPTEYLELHGPGRVRDLAMSLASVLPLASGHAGLALEFAGARRKVLPLVSEELRRYPGVDVPRVDAHLTVGRHVEGVHWLNFLGASLLQAVGGRESLRGRLQSPGTTVREVGNAGTVVVTLGTGPASGDLSKGDDLPAYRELARVLEPVLEPFRPGYALAWRGFSEDEVHCWWRRFLD
ncbi:type VI immunity family protein [Myxococcus sp. AS-1-15]|uniref:type VI immunity family protein n=1 Tax=Myxococcus sp. AS-1-15 TaxID=2874600 RepID=UPI001CC1A0AC|nr:DUF3396 domain-containing protein [Myxococcus sp. AS-1-15]